MARVAVTAELTLGRVDADSQSKIELNSKHGSSTADQKDLATGRSRGPLSLQVDARLPATGRVHPKVRNA